LEVLLEIEMTMKNVRAGIYIQRAGGREFQILGAATLKL